MTTSAMLALETEYVKTLLSAVISHADFCADLTIAGLRSLGVLPPVGTKLANPVGLPSSFLLELSAVLQIGCWELRGITQHIAAGLPSYRDGIAKLADRAALGPKEFAASAESALQVRVMAFWLRNFAWEGRPAMGADILLDCVDEETFLDLFAEFLWSNRRQIKDALSINSAMLEPSHVHGRELNVVPYNPAPP
jgi:hypothetical protein